jgi:hypothetical protein
MYMKQTHSIEVRYRPDNLPLLIRNQQQPQRLSRSLSSAPSLYRHSQFRRTSPGSRGDMYSPSVQLGKYPRYFSVES